jgi:Hemerythrin HHE cation binding domain
MERCVELAPLSREHHVALEVALRLRRATVADAEAVRDATLGFWGEEGQAHFRLEEEILLPAFARHVPSDDPDIGRVLAEHVDLRRRIADLESGGPADPAALNALGELLNGHVRHEERVLFPRIEAGLDGEELTALGAALSTAGAHHQPPRA